MSIDTVYAVADDALENQFEVIIPPFPGVIDISNTMVRVTEISVPETKIDVYTIDYKTQKFTKPKGQNATPNEFSFTFRVDKYWKIYEGFENWLKLIIDQDSGAMSPDVGVPGSSSLIRVPIDVIPVDSNAVVTKKGWTFTGCFINSLDGVTFKQGSGEVLTAKATMQFIKKLMRT